MKQPTLDNNGIYTDSDNESQNNAFNKKGGKNKYITSDSHDSLSSSNIDTRKMLAQNNNNNNNQHYTPNESKSSFDQLANKQFS